jgi:hypothetical protein
MLITKLIGPLSAPRSVVRMTISVLISYLIVGTVPRSRRGGMARALVAAAVLVAPPISLGLVSPPRQGAGLTDRRG